MPPLSLQRHKTRGSRNVNLECAVPGCFFFRRSGRGGLPPCLLRHNTTPLRRGSGESASVTQQTCVLCHTAAMSTVLHGRHVCCVRQQTFPSCPTADISAT